MQRPGQPVKGQSAIRPKARKAPTAQVSTADLQEQLDRAKRERDEALEQQAATSEVLKVISSSPGELEPVFNAILENATRICEAQIAEIILAENNMLRVAAGYGDARRLPVSEMVPLDRSTVMGRSICDQKPVHVADLQNASDEFASGREFAKKFGHRTILCVPLIREGRALGTILVRRMEVRPFEQKHIALLTTFADQAAIAIENVRLFRAEQQRTRELSEALEQQTATSEVLKVISSSPGELEPVFDAMLANATRICDAKFATLYLSDGDTWRAVAATHDAPPRYVQARKRNLIEVSPGGPLEQVVDTKQVVHIADLKELRPYRERHPTIVAAVELGRFRTCLMVPMLRDDELIGAISILRQEVRPFTDKQIELLQNFAAQAVIAIENTRLLSELRESLQQQTATADVLKVISRSTFDLPTVLNTLVESAARLCGADKAQILRPSKNEHGFYSAANYGHTQEYCEYLATLTFPPGREGVVGRVQLERKPVQIADVLADPEYRLQETQRLGGFRTHLGLPLLRDGIPIGILVVSRITVDPFSDKHIELLTTFADQAVIAIENVRLFDDVQKRTQELSESLEQQTATSEVLKVISSSPGELEPVFNAMLANATRICEAKFGVMYRYESDAFYPAAMLNAPQRYADFVWTRGRFLPQSGNALDLVLQSKQVIHSVDQSKERVPTPSAKLGGARSQVTVPMLKDGSLVGAIAVYRQEVRPFTDKQIELVENFAAQAVIAIENTRLLSELRESLQQQTATADVLKVISRSTFDLPKVLQTLVESAARLCDADKATITREKNGAFYRAESYGFSSEYMDYIKNVPIEPDRSSISGRSLVEGRAVHVADVTNDPEHKLAEAQRLGDYRTALAVPMLREGFPIGVLSLVRNEVRPFSDKQVDLVTTFADQAAIAIENVRLFDEVQARTRDLAESLQQQTATADVLKVISRSTFDLQPVLDTLTESAARLCDADLANIWRPHGSVYRLAASHRFIESKAKDYLENISLEPSRGSCVGRTLLEARTVHIHDIQSDPEYALETSKLKGWRTMLGVPLLREGVPIGVIALVRSTQRPFTAQQIELVTTFADQAVIAIENVRLFEDVQARTRELAKSLEQLRTTQDRLVQTQKLASLGQLTAGIAHEIKNPLNFVNNFSGISAELITELQEALADVSLNEKKQSEITELMDTLRGNLDKVVQHGKRADAIVKNMLLHSREGSGEHRLVDINAIVEESLNLAYHGARAEKQGFTITLERSLDPAAGAADVFPQDITRALLNLISNGFYAAIQRKAETNGGDYVPTLAASTKSLGDRVEIRIRDNGTGIPTEVKEKMFNPFFTTKPAGEGTGLGLSISHDIVVKQHGGSIEVDTQPGEFTEIRIILPRAVVFLPNAP